MKKWTVSKVVVFILMALYGIISLYPMIWMAFYSLKTNEEIFVTNPFGPPLTPQWSNYTKAINQFDIFLYFKNSVIVALASMFFGILFALMFTYVVARVRTKTTRFCQSLVTIGMFIPIQAVMTPLVVMVKNLHLSNTRWSLIVPYVALSFPFAVMVLYGFYRSLPIELEESAYLEGAGFYRTYFSIIFPQLNPDLDPDFFAACYGTDLEFGDTTSWAKPWMTEQDVEDFKGFMLEAGNEYYKKMIELTRAAVEDGKGKYMVGVTDLHPGGDGLVSMRGPQNLCYDVLDYPEFLQKGVESLLPGFQKIYEELYGITTKYQAGSTCWMGIWHPQRWYPVSCDFSCMISTETFEELLIDEIEKEVEYLDASIYHLDGPDALKHLDRILEIPGLGGVQWVYGAGNPTASHWIPEIRKIQQAGKCVQIAVVPGELEIMLEELPPEGLMYMIEAESEEDARKMLEMAERRRRL